MVNWISVRSILSIENIHEFPSRSIDYVLSFPQADLDVYVFVDLPLVMLVDVNRVEWVLKFKNSFHGLKEKQVKFV